MARTIKDKETLMERALKMLPAGIPAEAIADVEPNAYGDGYWIYLADGFWSPDMQCHTIHEDTLAALRYMVGRIEVHEEDTEPVKAHDDSAFLALLNDTTPTTEKEETNMEQNINNFSDIVVKDGYRLVAFVERGSYADAIIYREAVKDYVVCLYYDRTDGTWGQGKYVGEDRGEAFRILSERIAPAKDYDYRAAIVEDVREYIEENVTLSDYADKDEAREALNDEMWTADSVTGNGSGSYWFSAYKAERALMGNLDLLREAVEEFGGSTDVLSNGAEACDVTIRCYLLGEAIDSVLDEVWSDEQTA